MKNLRKKVAIYFSLFNLLDAFANCYGIVFEALIVSDYYFHLKGWYVYHIDTQYVKIVFKKTNGVHKQVGSPN